MSINPRSLKLIALACLVTPRVTSLCHGEDNRTDAAPNVDVVAEWRTFTTLDGLPHDRIRALHVTADRVWVGTDRGLAAYDGSAWKSWTEVDGEPLPAVSAIDVDEALAEVWLGTWGGGLFRFSGGRLDSFTQYDSGLAGDLLFSVVIDGRYVWAATNGGVCRYDRIDGSWDLYFARRADAPVPAITKLVQAGGRLYGCAWREGVYRFDADGNAWTRIEPATGPPEAGERQDEPDARGTAALASSGAALWWATQGVVGQRTDDDWNVFPRPTGLDPSPPRAAGLSRSQQSTRAAGFSLRERAKSGAFRRSHVLDAAARDDLTLWLATNRGVEVLVDGKTETWLRYASSDVGRGGIVRLIRAHTPHELRHLDTALPDEDVRCIGFFRDRVWVGTAGGLACSVEHQKWQDLPRGGGGDDSESGVPNNRVPYHDTIESERSRRMKPAARERRRIAQDHLDGEKATTGGRAADDEDATETVAIAVLGPRNPTIALPGQAPRREPGRGSPDLLALQLAVNVANADGGYDGRIPIDLVVSPPGYTRYGWGLPEDDFASFALRANVVGVVGRLRPDDHMTDAVALWTGLPLVNVEVGPGAGADRPSENPWVFRCHGDAPRRHRLLLDYLFDKLGHKRVAAIRTPGSAAGLHLDWWASHAAARGRPLVAQVDYDPVGDDLAAALETIRSAEPDVVLTWCDAVLSAKMVRHMRAMGMEQVFVGGPQIVDDRFARLVDSAGGPVLALHAGDWPGKGPFDSAFAQAYAERNLVGSTPTPPTVEGHLSYEAAGHLLEAIERAGPDRAAVRRALLDMAHSANGETHFEQRHKDGTTALARLTDNGWTVQTMD